MKVRCSVKLIVTGLLFQSTLSDEELKGLDDVYLGTYKKKYPVVGYMEYLVAKHADRVTDRFSGEL